MAVWRCQNWCNILRHKNIACSLTRTVCSHPRLKKPISESAIIIPAVSLRALSCSTSKPHSMKHSTAMMNFALLPLLTSVLASPIITNETLLAARQSTACGTTMGVTRLVGDGNPHQNYLQKQLSVSSSNSNTSFNISLIL